MEIILKQDVSNLGFKDDIVTVKNGYGRNYLIPQGLAVLATPSARKVLAENLKQRAFKEKKIVEDAQRLAKTLQSLEIKIAAKAGAGDKLFGSINSHNLVEELAKLGHSLDKKYIHIAGGSIKRLGKYEANVRLHRDVIISLPFEIIKENKEE